MMRLHHAHPSHQDCLILMLSSMFTVPNLFGVWQRTPSDSVSAWHLSVLSAWNSMVAKFGLWCSAGCPNSAGWSGSGSTGPWMWAFLLWYASFALESAPDKHFLPFTQLFSCCVKALRPVNMWPHMQVWINTWSESDMLGVKAWDGKELAEPQSNTKYHHSTTKYCSIQGLELLQCQDTSQSNSFPPQISKHANHAQK